MLADSQGLEQCLDLRGKEVVMFPLWFFVLLIAVVCYLLYVTRTTEEDLVLMSRTHLKNVQAAEDSATTEA